MTGRIPLDHLTSDALDALYDRLERAEKQRGRYRDSRRRWIDTATTSEAAIDRVRAIQSDDRPVHGDRSQGYRNGWNECLAAVHHALDGPPSGTAATQATDEPPTIDNPAYLRQMYARAIHRYDNEHALTGNDIPSKHHYGEADAVMAVRDRYIQLLQQRLTLTNQTPARAPH